MSKAKPVHLWIKPELFMNGQFPIAENGFPLKREHILKLIKCKCFSPPSGKFPFQLRYSKWCFCLHHHFGYPNHIVHLIFNNLALVFLKKPEERRRLDERLALCRSEIDYETCYADEVLPVSEFILLLYLQNIHSMEQLSTTYLEEEWSTLLSSGHNTKVYDEIKHFKFVKSNLEEMVELFEKEALLKAGRISMESVAILGMIIEGFQDRRSLMTLKNLVLMEKDKLAHRKEDGTISVEHFCTWVKTHLEVNPFGLAQCLKTGQKLPWLLKVPEKERPRRTKSTRAMTNAHSAPLKKKIVAFVRIQRQTVSQTSRILHGATVHTQQCSNSFIYLLSPIRSMWIENCHDCTFVIGPVATTLEVLSCTNLRVISVARRIQIRKCTKCTLYVLTPTSPLMIGDKNNEIILAPYNTHYPKLEEHMVAAGISKSLDLWNVPLVLGNRSKNNPCFVIMPPEEFTLFTIPFRMDGTTKSIPNKLLDEYAREIDKRNTKSRMWKEALAAAQLTKEDYEQVHSEIGQMFWEWCVGSGNHHELLTLEAYVKHFLNAK